MNILQKIAGWFAELSRKVKEDKTFAALFYAVIAILVICVIIIIFAVSFGGGDDKKPEQNPDDMSQQQGTQEAQDANVNIPNYTVKEVALEENAYADVNEFVNRYFAAMTSGDTAAIQSMQNDSQQKELLKIEKESAYIDEFDGLKVYTKPGPLQASYVTFVYYEIKFSGIDTLAPGLTTLYICSNADGSLYINSMLSDQDTDYIQKVVAQEDVGDLFSLVETKYAEAIDADANLSSFMEGLSAKLDTEVSEAMAAIEAAAAEEGSSQEPQEGEETPSENVLAEKVKATDTVNVRSSDSENADRIGQIAQGDTITRYEAKANGWSRVDYNGSEGYIKSEFLQPVEQAQAPADEPAEQPAESAGNQTDSSAAVGSLAGKSKITIKETVNVRKSSSQDSEKIGVAYEGETYELVMEQADGWCKIKYNGQTGFVKTEYVE